MGVINLRDYQERGRKKVEVGLGLRAKIKNLENTCMLGGGGTRRGWKENNQLRLM